MPLEPLIACSVWGIKILYAQNVSKVLNNSKNNLQTPDFFVLFPTVFQGLREYIFVAFAYWPLQGQ